MADRWYPLDGVQAPSVTTVCKRAGLSPDLRWVSPEHLEWLGVRGTAMHDYATAVLLGEKPIELPVQFHNLAQSFDEWFLMIKPMPVLVEQAVANRVQRYAGRLDLLCWVADDHHNASLKLMDFKARRGTQLDGYQLAGYVMAVEDMIRRNLVEVKHPTGERVDSEAFRRQVERVVVGLRQDGRMAEHHHCMNHMDFYKFSRAVKDFWAAKGEKHG